MLNFSLNTAEKRQLYSDGTSLFKSLYFFKIILAEICCYTWGVL